MARIVSCCHLVLNSPLRCVSHRRRRSPHPQAKSIAPVVLRQRFDSSRVRRPKSATLRRQFTRRASGDHPPVAPLLAARVGPVKTVHRSRFREPSRPSLGVERLADVLPPRAGCAIHSTPVAVSTIGLLGTPEGLPSRATLLVARRPSPATRHHVARGHVAVRRRASPAVRRSPPRCSSPLLATRHSPLVARHFVVR